MRIVKSLIFVIVAYVAVSCGSDEKGALPVNRLPRPVYDEAPELVDLYWKAWELAWNRVRYQDGVPQSPYMDENLWDDTIWIWDTEFMVLFCRYAPDVFPGIESLDNFYRCILDKEPSSLRIQHPDNPPFYAWVEWEYYKMTGDRNRLCKVLVDKEYLQRHYRWFDSLRSGTQLHFDHAPILLERDSLGYRWGNIQSGMDNTPRATRAVDRDSMLWMDALAQQVLSARYISRIARELGESGLEAEYDSLYRDGKVLLDSRYWDETDGFYYDLEGDGSTYIKARTPAVYWAMLAGVPDDRRAGKLAAYAADSREFGGRYPWPTVSRRDEGYDDSIGDYWRGSVWLPTAYMATKALEEYGYHDIADCNARRLLQQMSDTYRDYEPHTIWECYSPSAPRPGECYVDADTLYRVRPDFCGWSALGPISMFIENVIGFHNIDAVNRLIEWRMRGDTRQGIENLRFGSIITDIIAENGRVTVTSNDNYTLRINGEDYTVVAGQNCFDLDHRDLTVLQWNVWLEGTRVDGGRDAVVEEIARLRPDFVTLSEVKNYDGIDFTGWLCDELASRGTKYYTSRCDDSGLLSRTPIDTVSVVFPLQDDCGSIYRAVTTVAGREIALYTGHLDWHDYACYNIRGYDGATWQECAREVNRNRILELSARSQRVPAAERFMAEAGRDLRQGRVVILGGDFNEPSCLDWNRSTVDRHDHNGITVNWPVTSMLEAGGFVDAYRRVFPDPLTHPGITYPSDVPALSPDDVCWAPKADDRDRIDFVFYAGDGLDAVDAAILGPDTSMVRGASEREDGCDRFIEPAGLWPSDHKGVYVQFSLKAGSK